MAHSYIALVLQEAGFQSRSILAPTDKFLEVRNKEYGLLKEHATDRVFTIKGVDYNVPRVLVNNLSLEEGCLNVYTCDKTPYLRATQMMLHYADESDGLWDLKDYQWLNDSIFNVCGGFNHITNYLNLLKTCKDKGVELFDSFLVLESRENKLQTEPRYDTVNEMLLDMYST